MASPPTLPYCPSHLGLYSIPGTQKEKPNAILIIQQVSSELGTAQVQVPFSLQDLWEAKVDFRRFSDDPDQCIEDFQNVIQLFKLTWNDLKSDPHHDGEAYGFSAL